MAARCMPVGIPFVVTVERTPHEYIASCDELCAVASGATEKEAIANLKLTMRALHAQEELCRAAGISQAKEVMRDGETPLLAGHA